MTEVKSIKLSDLAETALIPLYVRALESQRPDGLIKDKWAEDLIQQVGQETLRKTLALTEETGRVALILKSLDFDRFARDFMMRYPDGVIVHIGCGLDTRFERVDNGMVNWYDLDLAEMIELRRKLLDSEDRRHHFLACSLLDSDWPGKKSAQYHAPVLFIAEGVFEYFYEPQVRAIVLSLKKNFPGAELAFDAYSPFLRWAHNLKVARTKVGVALHWDVKNARDIERWGEGIRLLEERYPFRYPEPRLRKSLMIRLVPFLASGIGVFRYRL